ncbi:MAG: hypothetical protein V4543_05385 [Bacteroidota bacterium]
MNLVRSFKLLSGLPALPIFIFGITALLQSCIGGTDKPGPITAPATGCRVSSYRETRDTYYSGYKAVYNSFKKPTRISHIDSRTGQSDVNSYDDYTYDGNQRLVKIEYFYAGSLTSTQTFSYVGDKAINTVVRLSGSNPNPQTTTYAYDGAGNLKSMVNTAGDSTLFSAYIHSRPGAAVTYNRGVLRSSNKYIYDGNGNLLQDSAALVDDISHKIKQYFLFRSYKFEVATAALYTPTFKTFIFPNAVDRGLITESISYYVQGNNSTQQIKTIAGSKSVYTAVKSNDKRFATGMSVSENVMGVKATYTISAEYNCD